MSRSRHRAVSRSSSFSTKSSGGGNQSGKKAVPGLEELHQEVMHFGLDTTDFVNAGSTVNVNLSGDDSQREKLNRDEARLLFIQDTMTRSDQLSRAMAQILDSFETRLEDLEELMLPINQNTQKLTRAYENIDDTIQDITETLEMFHVHDEEEPIIHSGVRGGLVAFLESMERVIRAIEFLQANRGYQSAAQKLEELNSLLHDAVSESEQFISQTLSKHSGPIDPSKLLETNAAIEFIPKKGLKQLMQVINILEGNDELGYISLVVSIRSTFMMETLSRFRPSQMLTDQSEGGGSGQYLVYNRGSHRFITFIHLFTELIKKEHQLIDIMTDFDRFNECFLAIIEPTCDQFLNTGRSLVEKIRNENSVFGVFIMIDLFDEYGEQLDTFNEMIPAGEVLDSLLQFYNDLKNACRQSLKEATIDVANHSSKTASKDATVNQLTSNTMNYLKRLLEHRDTVESMLPSVDEYVQIFAVTETESTSTLIPNTSLEAFIVDILVALESNLDVKKQMYKDAIAASIFSLNNVFYILKNIRNSDLVEIVPPSFVNKYEGKVGKESQQYLDEAWMDCISHLLEINQKGKTSTSKQHKMIKEMFNSFNSSFEEQYRAQQEFAVPDEELRSMLRRDIIELVMPLYKDFLQRYEGVQFAKNIGKYLKYDDSTLESMFENFFEG